KVCAARIELVDDPDVRNVFPGSYQSPVELTTKQ
ncbi:hypothetical protein MNBD_ACTINO02-2541, partial [hydrothermal vent metagenome]